ncbi:hypothetical protein COY17_01365 [Candidatus Saccharibacteria bacterium CG_4_10_14_0_2_um_filter_52_9]|nr:MAG: hypothetical protein COY17_01365 [Candidatus Saccharibacteria bacterium CG_4_10_14_0_2_um_filter_52_9]
MDDAKSQLAEKLKTANNILVTVSRNPSVDQLSALLGLTLLLNKQGKHAAAVFSGEVPSTLEFLQPEETIEKTTDSLRDFIIALDKNKADKLRYKVEDNVVRIFITPYKTSINQDDFEFTQGDFNVDVVVAIGVQQQEDLDEAITAHGRILHDATVASLNVSADGGLGSISWHAPQASSLSELVADLAKGMGSDLLDEQISTALLTGIVAETDRFRNEKTSAQTMSLSAALMSAGANQQLVASKLDVPENTANDDASHDGSIAINHANDESEQTFELPSPEPEDATPTEQPPAGVSDGPKIVTEPPSLGGTLTANSSPPALDPVTDPLSMPQSEEPQLLDHTDLSSAEPAQAPTPPLAQSSFASNVPINKPLIDADGTLTQLEESVGSSHVEVEHLDTARDEVSRALNDSNAAAASPEPIQALNAQPLGTNLRTTDPAGPPQLPQDADPNAPPPVPPPIPFQFGNPPQSQ